MGCLWVQNQVCVLWEITRTNVGLVLWCHIMIWPIVSAQDCNLLGNVFSWPPVQDIYGSMYHTFISLSHGVLASFNLPYKNGLTPSISFNFLNQSIRRWGNTEHRATVLIQAFLNLLSEVAETDILIVRNAILALLDKWLSVDTRLMDEQIIIAQVSLINLGQVHIWFRTSADAMLLVRRTSASQISRNFRLYNAWAWLAQVWKSNGI